MNLDQIRGALNVMKGKWLAEFGLVVGNHQLAIRGKHAQLLGRLQLRYGALREEADHSISTWAERLS